MKNLNNLLTLTVFWLLSNTICQAQVLKTSALNLNAGGIIHDMAYDNYYKAYIVVGSFDSINGIARKNLAFIKASDFTVMTQTPITSINGEIRSIEIRNDYTFMHPTLGLGSRNRIYVGGKFTLINGQAREHLAQLTANHYFSSQPVGTVANYNLTTWSSHILTANPTYSVNDLELRNDTLFAAGVFLSLSPGNGLSNDVGGILVYDINSASGNCLSLLETYSNLAQSDEIFEIEVLNNSVYVAGNLPFGSANANLKKVNFNNTWSAFSLPGISGPVWDIAIHDNQIDTAVLSLYKFASSDYNAKSDLNGNLDASQNSWDVNSLIEIYKNKIFGVNFGSPNQLKTRNRNVSLLSGVTNTITLNSNWTTIVTNTQRPRSLFRENNFLFLSGNTLTTVNSQSRKGLAVFCLEPMDAKDFTSSDLTICEGNVRTYTIPTTDYATGYKWTYTGTGASYRVAGTSDALQPLTMVNISNVNANSIEIHFGIGTTGGTLTVEPFCTCNTTTDYLYSVGKSITLTTAPLPNISMLDTMNFTCAVDTLLLQINSTTSGVSYNWEFYNAPVGTTSSILINKDDNGIEGFYYGTVIEPINGCSRMDSTFVGFDTIPAPITSANIVSNPSVFNCLNNTMVLDGSVSSAMISWATAANPTNILPSPLSLYSTDTLNLIMYATYNSNGCTAQTNYSITIDQMPATGALSGYPNFPLDLITDTINCINPTLSLTCEVIGSEPGTAEWIINSNLNGDQLSLTVADSIGMDQVFHTKTYQFQTLNSSNGCTQQYDVVVFFDLDAPFVSSQNDASLNCSQSSVILNHLLSSGDVIEGWLDASLNQTGVQNLNVTTIGEYYYQVLDTLNGCIARDTVNIIQTIELLLDLVDDTLICPNQIVNISVSPINNTESCTYTWSNGNQNQTTSAVGGVDNELSVIVTNTSGCVGYDTVNISVTAPVLAEFEAVSGCTSVAIQISNVSGGSGNYSYSLDQQNWQTTAAFTDLALGNYNIYVKDDLGCVYSFNQNFDGSGIAPDLNFLVSTYNEIGDTIALVNISGFTGFDSLTWTIPAISSVLSVEDSLLVLSIDSEGWYEVVLNGYIDTCMYSFKKTFYFGMESPQFDEDNNSMGIQSLVVFPNPTTGFFTVEFTLGIEQNYTIVVTNLQGQAIVSMSEGGIGTIVSKDFSFPLGTPPGNYRIHIISDFDAEQRSIILSN